MITTFTVALATPGTCRQRWTNLITGIKNIIQSSLICYNLKSSMLFRKELMHFGTINRVSRLTSVEPVRPGAREELYINIKRHLPRKVK